MKGQGDSSFPTEDHKAILNKISQRPAISQRPTESGRTLAIRINHNRSTALERSVINNWGV